MTLRLWIMLGVWLCALPAMAALPDTVSVQLFHAYPGLQSVQVDGPVEVVRPVRQILPPGRYRLKVDRHRLELSVMRPAKFLITAGSLTLKPLSTSGLRIQADGPGFRYYPGTLDFQVDGSGHLSVVNRVAARTYTALVVASETLPGWPEEALKAQAVLTQTRLARMRAEDRLVDSTQQEAYLGLAHRRAAVEQAVNRVWGEILAFEDRPVQPFYHAACAGGTSDGGYFARSKSPPYLRPVRCDLCKHAPLAGTTRRRLPADRFSRVFGPGLPRITHRDGAGRPRQVVTGHGQSMSGYDFWLKLGQQFGWDKAPGTRYRLYATDQKRIIIESSGGGHGVGLCQWGAAAMARRGSDYREILRYYFPGTQVRHH